MRFDFGFYSSLLLITFSQGIIFTLLILIKAIKEKTIANYLLSSFTFLCSLIVAPWMLGFAGWYDNQPYRNILFYLPFQHLLLIGPVIYFYTQSILNPLFKFKKKDILHFLPGILYILYIASLAFYDIVIVKENYFYSDGMDKDFDPRYQDLGFISMIIYFLISIRYYTIYKKLIVNISSNAYQLLFEWIRNFLYAFLLMLIIKISFDILSIFYPKLNSYEGGWWFYLFFSIVLYYIAITGYSNGVKSNLGFDISLFENKTQLLLHKSNTLEESTVAIEPLEELKLSKEIEEWKLKITTLISTEKLYQNPELTLTEVAKKLNTNISIISKAINLGFKQNFNDFINNYRIEAIIESFANDEHKKNTLLGIAFDAGFNSKATFNRAFKKSTGSSPKEYLAKLK